METSEPEFYYLIRHPDGEVVGAHKSDMKYGRNATFGTYQLEPTTADVVETLIEFGAIDEVCEEQKVVRSDYMPEQIVSKP